MLFGFTFAGGSCLVWSLMCFMCSDDNFRSGAATSCFEIKGRWQLEKRKKKKMQNVLRGKPFVFEVFFFSLFFFSFLITESDLISVCSWIQKPFADLYSDPFHQLLCGLDLGSSYLAVRSQTLQGGWISLLVLWILFC